MLDRIAEGEAEGILAWHPDRLSRNFIDGARVIELVERGAVLMFPTFRFDRTPHGIFCLSLAFGQSKLFVDNLSENVRRGLRNKARRGLYPHQAPVGYINNRNTKSIDPDPEYAPLVVSLFEKYSTGRHTLKELRLRNRSGNLMSVSSTQGILRNPIYYGVFRWGRETHEGTHTPLITKTLFDKCLAVMEQRGHVQEKHDPQKHPFRNLLKCDHCGCSITSSIAKGRYLYYHCGKRKGRCPGKYVSERAIDEEIRSALQKVSLTPADAERIETELRKLHEKDIQAGASRTDTLRSAIEDISKKLDTLLDLHLSHDISREEYIVKKKKLIEEKTVLKEKSRRVSGGGAAWFEPAVSILNRATTIQNALSGTEPAQLADCFREVGLNPALRAETIVFQPRSGWKALYDGLLRSPSVPARSCDSTNNEVVRSCLSGRNRTRITGSASPHSIR